SNIPTAQNAQNMTSTGALNIDSALSTNQTAHDTEAYIGQGASLMAGGAVSVTANETIQPSDALDGQGTGALVSVGGTVAVITVNSAVQAFVEDGAAIDAGGDVTIGAHFTDNITAKTYAGSAGFVGLGAPVSIITDNAVESATLGHAPVTPAGTPTGTAT